MKRSICLALSIIMVFYLTACSGNAVYTPDKFDEKAASEKLSDTVVAENSSYKLEWDSVNAGIALVEKSTGKRWGTTPLREGEATVDEYGMPIKKNPQLQSSVMIEYLNDEQKKVETAISYTGAYKNGRMLAESIENGIKVKYYFDKAQIMVPVEYVLREDSVAVTVNPKEVQENENQLLSVSLAPFWCSAENDGKDSYLFLPSGSGTLVSCATLSQQGSKYSYSVYGDDAVMQKEDLVTTEKALLLPVFGAKSGDTATCAIIESAAESAKICTILGSSAIKYSTVYATYQLRGYSSNIATMLYNETQKRDVYAESMATAPMTIGFYPLKGEKANYSGMAEVYKNHLKASGFLNEKVNDNALNLTFVGGTMMDKSFLGIPYRDLLAATTIKDVEAILKEISTETDTPINAKLLGFGDTGIDISDYAGGFKISKNIGTVKDLSKLSDFCKGNGISLYFDFDLIRFKENSSGYNSWFDVSHNACYKTAIGYKYDVATHSRIEDKSFYYLSRENLLNGADKLLKKINKWNIEGISLSSLSNIAYSDYSNRKNNDYYSQSNMAKDVSGIVSKLASKYKFAATDANAYAAVMADIIYDVPSSSSREKSFMCDIPFYQMVFKGYVPMAGESLNLAAEPKKQLLSYIESGSGLSFTLTANYYNEFIDAQSYYFFGTKYDDLKTSLFENYKEFKDYYNAVNGAVIISHNILENGLRETVFDNGVKAYVNYSNEKTESPIGEVEALGYIWR